MINKLKSGEIVLADLKASNGNKVYKLESVVYSRPYDGNRLQLSMLNFEDRRLIKKFGAKEDLRITDIKIIKHLGFKHKTNKYHEARKSEEKRNTITGSYD